MQSIHDKGSKIIQIFHKVVRERHTKVSKSLTEMWGFFIKTAFSCTYTCFSNRSDLEGSSYFFWDASTSTKQNLLTGLNPEGRRPSTRASPFSTGNVIKYKSYIRFVRQALASYLKNVTSKRRYCSADSFYL